jgi:hypothetical protein
MLLAVFVVIKSYDMELPEAGGQFGDRRDLDTDMVRTYPVTGMCPAFVK